MTVTRKAEEVINGLLSNQRSPVSWVRKQVLPSWEVCRPRLVLILPELRPTYFQNKGESPNELGHSKTGDPFQYGLDGSD